MLLKVITPTNIITKEKVGKVIGEDPDGSFGILPKHIDFVTKIVPSILVYTDDQGEGYIGVDEGILVKQQDVIQISVQTALESRNLGQLHNEMEVHFKNQEEEEEQTALETTKLELGIVKSFYDLKALSK
ncbi:MAG: F0F1 ATP synthase subunit epsilon [Chlamydiae bacterium CG10_big_fil_rev_8_21_14_0_10_35_9]|nr:MAG: F0F1 ATP synthase subunit epsilon [Chlamydiae bacterium CG10_big_fil_rev_8_21_14_0_10_35_9]